MTLSVFVFDISFVKDTILSFLKKVINVLPIVFYMGEETEEKEADQKQEEAHSPPETLGIGITEEVGTKDGLA